MAHRRFLVKPAFVCASLVSAMATTTGLAEHRTVAIEPLGIYSKLDASGVTVSGISSGAFFAHQFHVAYSGLVTGAGMVAGGLYACAEQVDRIVPPFGNPFTGIPKSGFVTLMLCGGALGSDWLGITRPWSRPATHGQPRLGTDGGCDERRGGAGDQRCCGPELGSRGSAGLTPPT